MSANNPSYFDGLIGFIGEYPFGAFLIASLVLVGMMILFSSGERSLECKQGHFEERLVTEMAGKVPIVRNTSFFICDKK